MTELIFIYSEQQRRRDVQAALGGELRWDEETGMLHWFLDDGRETTVPWPSLDEPFDIDEWVDALRADWIRHGVGGRGFVPQPLEVGVFVALAIIVLLTLARYT